MSQPATIAALEGRVRIAMAAEDWHAAEMWGRALDSALQDEQNPPVPLGAAALWYAEQGLRVFPCKAYCKEPMTSHGFQDATTELDEVRWWWFKWPQANIGIATGHLVNVIDVDPGGVDLWKIASDQITDLPAIIGTATTRRPGGLHCYVVADDETTAAPAPGVKNSPHPGIDYKARGGYVIAPPSIVDQDDAEGRYVAGSGVRYRWVQPLDLARLAAGSGAPAASEEGAR